MNTKQCPFCGSADCDVFDCTSVDPRSLKVDALTIFVPAVLRALICKACSRWSPWDAAAPVTVHPPTGPAVTERMVRIARGPYVARLWLRDDDGVHVSAKSFALQQESIDATAHAMVQDPRRAGFCRSVATDVAMHYASIVNAIEVVDESGSGAVVYPEWP